MENTIICAGKNYTKHPDTSMFMMHTHEDYEIYCFLKGSAKYFVEGNIYPLNPGDILIMKKAEAHSLLINRCIPYERIVINFSFDALLGDSAKEIISFIDNRPLGKHNLYSAEKFTEYNWLYYLNKICDSTDINEQKLYLTVLLNELYLNHSKTSSKNVIKDEIVDILEYINHNLASNITLDYLCEHFYLSKTHLIRKFKNITGSTVWEYILTKRLILAKELMQNGERPTDTFLKCGFKDYSSFFKAYKNKYNRSPKADYIKLNRTTP